MEPRCDTCWTCPLWQEHKSHSVEPIRIADLMYDSNTYVMVNTKRQHGRLTRNLDVIFVHMVKRVGKLVTYETLIELTEMEESFRQVATLRVQMVHLRNRIRRLSSRVRITATQGIGYVMEVS